MLSHNPRTAVEYLILGGRLQVGVNKQLNLTLLLHQYLKSPITMMDFFSSQYFYQGSAVAPSTDKPPLADSI